MLDALAVRRAGFEEKGFAGTIYCLTCSVGKVADTELGVERIVQGLDPEPERWDLVYGWMVDDDARQMGYEMVMGCGQGEKCDKDADGWCHSCALVTCDQCGRRLDHHEPNERSTAA
jgi:hypothetical protein